MTRVHVVGAGAVGCYFGVQLQRAGNQVTFVARPSQAEALIRDGLLFESQGKTERVRIDVVADPSVLKDAQLVLICVKSYDTAATARELAPHLQPDGRVLCLQNGATNHEIFEAESNHPAIPAVVYVGAQMESATHLLHNGAGNLVIGSARGRSDPIDNLVALFQAANIPSRISDFIERDLWEKLIINCALNGISACTGAKYGAMMGSAPVRQTMEQIVREGVAVANALKIPLDFELVKMATWKVGDSMPATLSSTAQDIQRRKRTEIDFLNGHLVTAGKQVGVATPVNQAILAMVSLLESTR